MITYIPHLVTFTFAAAILVFAAINFRLACKYTSKDLLQILVFMGIGWQVTTILFFMYNQSIWVLKEHEQLVGTVDSTLWLMYDYSNKFFHLTSGLILYYYLSSLKNKRTAEERVLSRWTCPIVDTSELDKVKACLDKLGQHTIPTVEVDCERHKGDKQ